MLPAGLWPRNGSTFSPLGHPRTQRPASAAIHWARRQLEPIPAQHHLAGWIPWKAAEPGPDLAWLPLDGGRFHEPFFEDTLGRLKRAHAVFYGTRTLFDLLDADLEGLERLQPALLVFHISRCGSTLLAQMLGTDPAVEVLSEPPLLDHLLRSGQDSRIDPLLALLGQRRFPESRHLVLKLDSWHLAFHGRLRALYPTVPCVLLYREPARVMASHRLLRGMHALPGVLDPALFGFDPRELPQPTLGVDAGVYLDSHLELVLGRYFEWMQAIARGDRNSLCWISRRAPRPATAASSPSPAGVPGLRSCKPRSSGPPSTASTAGCSSRNPRPRPRPPACSVPTHGWTTCAGPDFKEQPMTSDPEFRILDGFLGAEALGPVSARRLMDGARFQRGAATATDAAQAVKHNLQVDPEDQQTIQALQMLMLQAVNASRAFREHALPKELHDPRFALYRPGMAYGWHVDSPLMGHPTVRTDFAMTVFLDPPEAYSGGELELQTPGRYPQVQLRRRGRRVLYSCGYLHRVAEVTSGQRRVMATWIQSLVPDPVQRGILAALQSVHSRLEPQSQEALDLQQQLANLTRLWIRN